MNLISILNYLVILFRCWRNVYGWTSDCTSLNNSVLEPLMYLGADHEKALDAHSNNAGLSTIGHRSGIPSSRDFYSSK